MTVYNVTANLVDNVSAPAKSAGGNVAALAEKMRGLAVTLPQRDAKLPQVPSAVEAGLADFQITTWTGFYAPKGTPRELVLRIQRDIVAACNDAQLLARFEGLGGRPVTSTPEEFAAFTRSEIERFGKIIRAANIKLD